MQYPINKKESNSSKELIIVSLFVAQAIILSYFERFIPLELLIPVPGVKLGLANIVILTAIYRLSFWQTSILVILKVFIVSMLFGTPITMLYSLAGSLLSFGMMQLTHRVLKDQVTPIGVSVIGSIFHILGQLLTAGILLGNFKIFVLMPYLLVTGVISGSLIGLTVKYLRSYIRYI